MRKTASHDLYNRIQYMALKNAPPELSSRSLLLYIFPHNQDFSWKLNFILWILFMEPSLQVCVWQKPKTAFDLVYKTPFLLSAPVQSQHDLLWKQHNISYIWVEKETEESFLPLFYEKQDAVTCMGFFPSTPRLCWTVLLKWSLLQSSLICWKKFRLFKYISISFFLPLF